MLVLTHYLWIQPSQSGVIIRKRCPTCLCVCLGSRGPAGEDAGSGWRREAHCRTGSGAPVLRWAEGPRRLPRAHAVRWQPRQRHAVPGWVEKYVSTKQQDGNNRVAWFKWIDFFGWSSFYTNGIGSQMSGRHYFSQAINVTINSFVRRSCLKTKQTKYFCSYRGNCWNLILSWDFLKVWNDVTQPRNKPRTAFRWIASELRTWLAQQELICLPLSAPTGLCFREVKSFVPFPRRDSKRKNILTMTAWPLECLTQMPQTAQHTANGALGQSGQCVVWRISDRFTMTF